MPMRVRGGVGWGEARWVVGRLEGRERAPGSNDEAPERRQKCDEKKTEETTKYVMNQEKVEEGKRGGGGA